MINGIPHGSTVMTVTRRIESESKDNHTGSMLHIELQTSKYGVSSGQEYEQLRG